MISLFKSLRGRNLILKYLRGESVAWRARRVIPIEYHTAVPGIVPRIPGIRYQAYFTWHTISNTKYPLVLAQQYYNTRNIIKLFIISLKYL
jgi:hypothetical protein